MSLRLYEVFLENQPLTRVGNNISEHSRELVILGHNLPHIILFIFGSCIIGGSAKALTLLIEGESLFNDGTSIIMFEIFRDLAIDPYDIIASELAIKLVLKIFLRWLGMSGVISVTMLGLLLDTVNFSPEIEVFLLRFWEMLTYLANTLIFIIVGVVIAERSFEHLAVNDGFYIVVLYFALNIIRLVMIIVLSPLLSRIGYGFSWRWASVSIWSGIRGAFSLNLALMAFQSEGLDKVTVKNKVHGTSPYLGTKRLALASDSAEMSRLTDYRSSGAILGDLNCLTQQRMEITVTCETATQVHGTSPYLGTKRLALASDSAEMSRLTDYRSSGAILGDLNCLTQQRMEITVTCETATQYR
ncbi:UNVERIFIED_CONTAM: hypothetical protein FKN15_029037 [Acipenser sinensis]